VASVAGVQVELGEDRVDVLGDGAVGDHQDGGDLGVGASLGHQREHVALALRQRRQRVGATAQQQLGDHLGVERGAARGHPA
jgi:hypothetical protein